MSDNDLRNRIIDILRGQSVWLSTGFGGLLTDGTAGNLADAIEEALLADGLSIDARLSRYREMHIEAHRLLDGLGVAKGPAISSPTVLRRLELLAKRVERKDGITQEQWERIGELEAQLRQTNEAEQRGHLRTDAWVTEVAYQAAGAASGVFLREDPEKVTSQEIADVVADLLETFDIPRACSDCQQERIKTGQIAGQRWGKTEAMEKIREDAATPEDAEAAIREMEATGRCFMTGTGVYVGTQGGEPADERPPTADEEIEDDDPLGGSLAVRIGPDGLPWVSMLDLTNMLLKAGDPLLAGEQQEEEFDGALEIARALGHFRNAIRHSLAR